MEVTTFDAPWSRSLWGISVFSTIILCGVAALPIPGFWLVRLLPFAVLLGALPFVVRRYEVREGILLIRRLWWDTRLDLSGLRAVRFDPSVREAVSAPAAMAVCSHSRAGIGVGNWELTALI